MSNIETGTVPDLSVSLQTRAGEHALDVRVADSFLSRFRGLMLSKPLKGDQGLLITRCPSVHTAFMLFPIDVVYLDQKGSVLKCVPQLKPWRGSVSSAGRDAQGKCHAAAAHALELAAGTIARLAIAPGDTLHHPLWQSVPAAPIDAAAGEPPLPSVGAVVRQRGSAMVEFVVVGPIISLIGLAVIQYGMLFFAKNQMNHASFMAARAGSMGNAKINSVQLAYEKALIPLYGGGTNSAELAAALLKAQTDVAGNTRIEILNPTRESFDDWNDAALQATIGNGSRVIPNAHLSSKDPAQVKANSGQNIQDANMIKIRITHGYEPKVPLIKLVYIRYLKWLDTGTDSFHTQMVNAGRIPVVTHVTLQMQSDAIESQNVSMPGIGNNGNPTNPGDPPVVTTPPPSCATIGCSVPVTPTPVDPGGPCTGPVCAPCTTVSGAGNYLAPGMVIAYAIRISNVPAA